MTSSTALWSGSRASMSSCAAADSGWLVRLESEVSAEPSSVPIRPSETSDDRAPDGEHRGRGAGWRALRAARAEPDRMSRAFQLLSVCVAVARAGDPGDEDVVGVVDEVVASERVDEVALAAQVRGRDGHELAVAGRGRQGSGPGDEAAPRRRAKSAAATRIIGSSLVRDASTIAAIAAASPTAS